LDEGVLGDATTPMEEHVKVEEILNDHMTAHGLEYLVQFKGHTDCHNQWVPVNDVCMPGLILH
jgi:hypothetical protein